MLSNAGAFDVNFISNGAMLFSFLTMTTILRQSGSTIQFDNGNYGGLERYSRYRSSGNVYTAYLMHYINLLADMPEMCNCGDFMQEGCISGFSAFALRLHGDLEEEEDWNKALFPICCKRCWLGNKGACKAERPSVNCPYRRLSPLCGKLGWPCELHWVDETNRIRSRSGVIYGEEQ